MKINLSLTKIHTSNIFQRKYKARVRKNFHRSSSRIHRSIIESDPFPDIQPPKNLHFPTTSIRVSNLISSIHIISTVTFQFPFPGNQHLRSFTEDHPLHQYLHDRINNPRPESFPPSVFSSINDDSSDPFPRNYHIISIRQLATHN